MKEYLRKIGLLGLGIAVLTKEKAEEIANELIKKGEISQEEGVALAEDLLKQAEKQGTELNKKIDAQVKKTIKKINLASQDDIKSLEKKIKSLEKKINELKKDK